MHRRFIVAAFAALLMLAQASGVRANDALRAGFENPPDSAKPQTWWHWVNGNTTKAGITADLEAMKRVGLSEAQIFNVDTGIPSGSAPFMGARWRELIGYAVREAHRLGLHLCVHNGAGWSSSGGPWITPEYAMKRLTWSETPVAGPSHVAVELPRPPTVRDYYRDIAVLAVRVPENETATNKLRIRDTGVKAGFDRGGPIRPDLSPTPAGMATPRDGVIDVTAHMTADGKLTWDAPAARWTILRIGYTLTGAQNEPAPASGRGLECDKLDPAALDAHWAGMMATVIKQAGPLAGKTLDNVLIDSYETGCQNWTPKLREEFRKRCGYDILPFLPVVTGRVVDSIAVSERFLWDFRRVIADLWAKNYYGHFAQLCHEHGMKASTEPYGNGVFDNLQCGGEVDVPMGEFWVGGGAEETTKMAASAGHTYGRKVIGAESFTADDHHARWAYDLYSLKALGDHIFCLGVNRFILHRYAMQPWLHLAPGMTMGPWGTNFDRTNTWWEQSRAWMRYVARCQDLLQSGKFVADICYFCGDEGPNDLPGRPGIRPEIPAGYDYDGCDRQVLLHRMSVRDGRIVLSDGMRYRVLVLPESATVTPETLAKVRALVQAGATVVGPKPTGSPSLVDYPACDDAVRRMADEVWGDCNGTTVTSHTFGKGRVYWGKPLAAILHGLGAGPDFTYTAGPGVRVDYIHRATATADIYFVSNQRYRPESVTCTFRASGAPELWRANSGTTEPAPVYTSRRGGTTTIPLRLDPAGSVFVVFRHGQAPARAHLVSVRALDVKHVRPPHPSIVIRSARYGSPDGRGEDVTAKVAQMVAEGATSIAASNALYGDPAPMVVKQLRVDYTLNGKPMQQTVPENDTMELAPVAAAPPFPAYEVHVEHGAPYLIPWLRGRYEAKTAAGKSVVLAARSDAAVLTARAPWSLRFPPGLGAPPQVTLDRLVSWPDYPDPGVKHFSGTAEYRTTIDVPKAMLGGNRAVCLDLGLVKNIAEVWVNGKHVGILWKEPFCADVTGLLRPGRNTLVIRVTNLWPNRLIGDAALPDDVQWRGGTIAKWPDWLLEGKPRPKTGRVAFATWRFYGKDDPLLPSGLIGPVTVRSAQIVKLP